MNTHNSHNSHTTPPLSLNSIKYTPQVQFLHLRHLVYYRNTLLDILPRGGVTVAYELNLYETNTGIDALTQVRVLLRAGLSLCHHNDNYKKSAGRQLAEGTLYSLFDKENQMGIDFTFVVDVGALTDFETRLTKTGETHIMLDNTDITKIITAKVADVLNKLPMSGEPDFDAVTFVSQVPTSNIRLGSVPRKEPRYTVLTPLTLNFEGFSFSDEGVRGPVAFTGSSASATNSHIEP